MPFSYAIGEGYAGYTVDLCQRVVDALEAERGKPYANPPSHRWIAVTPQTRLIRLLAGDIDLECSSTSHTPARANLKLAFSMPIFLSDVAVLLRTDDGRPPASAEQWLANMRTRKAVVVTTEGATSVRHLALLNSGPQGLQFQVIYGRDHGDSLKKLLDNEAEAFVMDRAHLAAQWATNDRLRQQRIVLASWSPVADEVETYGIVMREADVDLQRVVQQTLCRIARSKDGKPSDLQQLHQRWFQQRLPLGGGRETDMPLGLDMNPALLKKLAERLVSDCPA